MGEVSLSERDEKLHFFIGRWEEGEMPKTLAKISIKMKFCTVILEHVRNEHKKSPINRALGKSKIHNGGYEV